MENQCYKTVTQTVTKSSTSVTFDKFKENIGITGLEEIVTDVTKNFR